MREEVAARLQPLLARILGDDPPIRVRAWDGSEFGPVDAPCFVIRHRRALRRLLWKPGELGLARAYIAGELDIEGDLMAALAVVQEVMWRRAGRVRLSSDDKREIVRTAVMLGAVGPEPRPPAEELTWARAITRSGPAGVDAAAAGLPRPPLDAVALHVDEVGTEFFQRSFGPRLTSTCADWTVAGSLGDAQDAANARVADMLGLAPGMRLLDAACGWGDFVIHAAAHYGVRAVGFTMSQEQARIGREQITQAGLTDRVEIVVGNTAEEVVGKAPYDAIAVLAGAENSSGYLPTLHGLLRPGGRLLTRPVSRPPGTGGAWRSFTTRYVFTADGRPGPLGAGVSMLEEAGFEIRSIGSLRGDQARTLRAWTENLQRSCDDAAPSALTARDRVWLLYLSTSALASAAGRIGLHEILSVRTAESGPVAVPAAKSADVRA